MNMHVSFTDILVDLTYIECIQTLLLEEIMSFLWIYTSLLYIHVSSKDIYVDLCVDIYRMYKYVFFRINHVFFMNIHVSVVYACLFYRHTCRFVCRHISNVYIRFFSKQSRLFYEYTRLFCIYTLSFQICVNCTCGLIRCTHESHARSKRRVSSFTKKKIYMRTWLRSSHRILHTHTHTHTRWVYVCLHLVTYTSLWYINTSLLYVYALCLWIYTGAFDIYVKRTWGLIRCTHEPYTQSNRRISTSNKCI